MLAGACAGNLKVPSGVAQLAERRTVNPLAVGSSPTPGAIEVLWAFQGPVAQLVRAGDS